MKAKAKHDFKATLDFGQRKRLIKKDDILEVILDENTTDESGEIRLDGEYVCDVHSPIARDHFFIMDDDETHDTNNAPSKDAERLVRLKNQGYTNLPYDDIEWLIAQADKAQQHEEWLNKIAEMNTNEHSAVDAAYWALLALGKV